MTTETDALASYCDACADDSGTLLRDPADAERMLCAACHAEQVAEIEADAKEQAIGEAQDELEGLLGDLKELKERIGEVRHTLRCAKGRLAALQKQGEVRHA